MTKNKFEWIGAVWFGAAAAVAVTLLTIQMSSIGLLSGIGIPFAIFFGGRNISKIIHAENYSLFLAATMGVLITIKSQLWASCLLALLWAGAAGIQSGDFLSFLRGFSTIILFSNMFVSFFTIPAGAVTGLALRIYVNRFGRKVA